MAEIAVRPPSPRRRAFVIVAAICGIALGLAGFAFISLAGSWFGAGGREEHKVHDLGWGVLGGIIISLPLLLQTRSPERKVALMQATVVSVVVLTVITTLSQGFSPLALIIAVLTAILVWLHPARSEFLSPGRGVSPLLAGLSLLALIPAVMYAADQVEIQKLDQAGKHWDEGHWATMAAMAIALPLCGLVAAYRASGWRILGFLVGGGGILFGLSSVVFENQASSVGSKWGAAAIIAGAVFILATEAEYRRNPGSTPMAAPE